MGLRAGLAVLILVFAFTYRFLSFELTDDDYIFFTLGRQIAEFGEWPVRDLVEEGDPLHNVISAGLQAAFGHSLAGEVMFDLAMLSAAAALAFLLAADVSRSITIAVATAALAVLASPRLYDYVKAILPMCAFWLCFRYVERPSRATAIGMGIFTTIAFLLRHDFGIFTAAACASAIAAVQVSARSFRPGPFVAYGAAGLAAVSPFLVYLQMYGGVFTYVVTARQYVNREVSRADDDPRPAFAFDLSRPLWQRNPAIDVNIRWADQVSDETRVNLERRYRLTNGRQDEGRTWKYQLADPAPENLRAIVADPHIEDTANIDRSPLATPEPSRWQRISRALSSPPRVAIAPGILNRTNAVAWLYYVLRILPIAAAIALVAALVRGEPDPAGWTKILPVVVFCVIAAPLLLRGNMSENNRLADLTYPVGILGAWILAKALRSGRVARSIAVVMLVFTYASVVAFAQVVETVRRVMVIVEPHMFASAVDRRIEDLTASPPPAGWLSQATGMRGAVHYLRRCTAPDDRVLVYGFYPELLFFSGRASAVDRAMLASGYWTRPVDQQRTLSAMQKGPVPVALIDSSAAGRASVAFTQSFPMIEQHLRERYRRVATSDFGASTGLVFDVWADPAREVVRVYEPFSLPCFR
jgi:hypothetical protein